MAMIKQLLVISHVRHYKHDGQLYAYGAYAREIEIWADMFPELVIAAPCRNTAPPGDAIPFSRDNIRICPQLETGGQSLAKKAIQILLLPWLAGSLILAMLKAQAVHVRCPGNLGLLGTLLAPLCCRRRIAKYAGQWNGYPGEARTVTFQRWLLRSRWWSAPVTVYGEWPNQPAHVVPFFTSILTEEQLSVAAHAEPRTFAKPIRLLYVGRLSRDKNVDTVIRVLTSEAVNAQVTVVGQGPMEAELKALSEALGVAESVTFTGGLAFDEVLTQYAQHDVLVLVSRTEGWPKAIAEGMAFGMVCIGSNRGLVPMILGDGRGIVIEPGDGAALVDAITQLAAEPERAQSMAVAAAEWASAFTIERLQARLRDEMQAWWSVELQPLTGEQNP